MADAVGYNDGIAVYHLPYDADKETLAAVDTETGEELWNDTVAEVIAISMKD